MSSENLPSSSQVFQENFLGSFVSRKLLLENPFVHHNTQQAPVEPDKNNLSGNVLMLLSILVCGIICSLGLHYIIRCAFRRSTSFMISDPISSSSSSSTPRANKGIKKKALKMFPVVNYSPEMNMNLSVLGEECVICLSDFAAGEQLRLLPICNHGFHVRCIDKWLTQHLTCPKCRHCLVDTCEKILGECDDADQVAVAATPATTPMESIAIRISPLEPEARLDTFRGSS